MAALFHPVWVLLLLAGASVVHATLTCNPGATLFGNRCYQVYRPGPKCPQDFNQTAAQQFCRANNGELASIHSQAQNDFIADLIKKSQHKKKDKCNACPTPKRDYFYWIGMELDHRGNGSVNGSSWTDNSPVNYGNPLSNSFRPPFVTGRPEGSVGDGSDPVEVCPPGNEKECVQIYGFGETVGKWRDQQCSNSHRQNVSCSCPPQGNSTVSVRRHKHKHSSSSSSSSDGEEEEDHIDECRDEAALNGLVCQYCPAGWTAFQGRCYKAVVGLGTHVQNEAKCPALDADSRVASIHSNAENQFVTNLAIQAGITGAATGGMRLTFNTNTFQAPPIAAANLDGSPAVYGNPLVAPWTAPGTYPWAQAIPPGIAYPNQPDNRPPPANCVVYWLPGPAPVACGGCPPGTWDDLECSVADSNGVVCKL